MFIKYHGVDYRYLALYSCVEMVLGSITGILALCFSIGASQVVNVGGGPLIIFMILFIFGIPFEFMIIGMLRSLMCCVYIIITGTSMVSIVRNFKKKSAVTGKHSIDYDLIILVCPVAASGVFFGTLTKNLISEMLLTTLEIFVMIYLIYKTCKENKILTSTSFQMYNNSRELQPINQKLLSKNPNEQSDIPFDPNEKMAQDKYKQTRYMHEQFNPDLNKIFEQEENRFSKSKLKIMSIVVLYTIFFFFIKRGLQKDLIVINPPLDIPDDFINGTEPIIANITDLKSQFQQQKSNFQSQLQLYSGSIINFNRNLLKVGGGEHYDPFQYTVQLKSCLFSTIFCLIIHLTISYLSSKSVAIQTVTKETEKQKYGYVFVRQSDKMSSKKMWSCMIAGFFSGVFVSLLGVGGSIVLVPALIKEGIDQQTATDSSTAVTIFSSVISILAAAFHNFYMPYPYLILFLFFILSGLITMLTYFVFNKMTANNISKKFLKKIKLILQISSLLLLIAYYAMQYGLNEKYFINLGYFC